MFKDVISSWVHTHCKATVQATPPFCHAISTLPVLRHTLISKWVFLHTTYDHSRGISLLNCLYIPLLNLQKPASASLCRKLGKYSENTRSSLQTCYYCPIKKTGTNLVTKFHKIQCMWQTVWIAWILIMICPRCEAEYYFSFFQFEQPISQQAVWFIIWCFFKQKNKQTMIHRSVCMALMAYCPLLLEVSKLVLIYSLVTLTVVWILGLSYFNQC